MKYTTVTVSTFQVAGISVRTTNENNQVMKDIPSLWDTFLKQDIYQKIPNKIDHEVIGLYTDYEKDATKPYTFIAGCRVNSILQLPEGFIGKSVPGGTFAKITTEGIFPESIMQAWQYIESLNLNRSYTGDFEVYGADFKRQPTDTVAIYVALQQEAL